MSQFCCLLLESTIGIPKVQNRRVANKRVFLLSKLLIVVAVLATGTKSGYTFTWTGGGTSGSYTILADPVVVNSTGTVHYFTDQSLVIRSNATAVATVNDNPIGN